MSRAEDDAPFRFRYATPADSTLLAELGAQTFAETFAADSTLENMNAYLAASFSPEKQARELTDAASRFLMIELDGTVVGYARLKCEQAPAAVFGRKPVEIARFFAPASTALERRAKGKGEI